MKLEIGKPYKTRDGQKVEKVERDVFVRTYPWSGLVGNEVLAWDDGGFYIGPGHPDPLDLVSEWTEGPVREVTRKEIVEGVYGQVSVIGRHTTDDKVWVKLVVKPGNSYTPLDASELRAAAATLIEIAGALE